MKDYSGEFASSVAFVATIFILAFWKACEIIWFLFNHINITIK